MNDSTTPHKIGVWFICDAGGPSRKRFYVQRAHPHGGLETLTKANGAAMRLSKTQAEQKAAELNAETPHHGTE